MRSYGVQFAQRQEAPNKAPRCVVAILFDVESIYCTSHLDIPNVPGIVFEGVVQEPSAISQRLLLSEGRSEIGSFDFKLVDVGGAFTADLRTKLADGAGLRGRTVKFYLGHEGDDFSAFQQFQTQLVVDAEEDSGTYSIQCRDVTREKHQDICEPASTTLRDAITENPGVIPVYDTSAFKMVTHGSSWSDAPGQTVGYVKIGDTVYRYTGKTADSLTGVTAGVLNTKAIAQTIDASTSADRRPKVEEYIYVELPALKAAILFLTGEYAGVTFPSHWHLAIDAALIRLTDFENIGADLWNPSDDSAAIVLRFEGLQKTDGKRFLEREIYTLLNCVPFVYSDGSLGLKRLPAMVRDAAPVMTLTDDQLISVAPLRHRLSSMYNVFRIDWNWDAAQRTCTRHELIIDSDSITANQSAPVKSLEFRGLYGSRHTAAIVRALTDALRDAYSWPPEEIEIELPGSLVKLELADVVRLKTALLRDYAGPGPTIDRSFLITNLAYDWLNDRLTASLFGSTFRPRAAPPGGLVASLPDSFYTSTGKLLSSVVTIVNNVVQSGTYTLTGHPDLNHPAARFFYEGDLTWSDGVIVNLVHNVVLAVRGHHTLNGDFRGVGGGKPGVADPGTAPWDVVWTGNSGYVGHARGWDGISAGSLRGTRLLILTTLAAQLTRGAFDAMPYLELKTEGENLLGLPSDLRGTGGGPGGRVRNVIDETFFAGGPGAAGGAGLCMISRGLSFGASATIDLSGADSASTAMVEVYEADLHPGSGGAGGPGALLILIDGSSESVPDITGKFLARSGRVAQAGHVMDQPLTLFGDTSVNPVAGFADPSVISEQDWSNAGHRIQYIPMRQVASPDAGVKPAAPTDLTVTPGSGFNSIRVAVTLAPGDVVQLFASLDNNRANAVEIARGIVSEFTHDLPILATRFYWANVRRPIEARPDTFSDWFPLSAFEGRSATTLNPGGWTPIARGANGASIVLYPGVEIQKSNGATDWDSDCYSQEGWFNGSYVSFRAARTDSDFMVGLNSDPATDRSYASIDFAWHCLAHPGAGNLEIYESGSDRGGFGTYDASTVLSITHDGDVVRYARNGVTVRTVVAPDRKFHFDSSFLTPGAKAIDVKFGPMGAAGESEDAGTVFLDTFEHQSWESVYNLREANPTPTITYPLNGEVGGHVLRVAGGKIWMASLKNIPFDSSTLYRMTIKVRRTAAATSGGSLFYAALEGVAFDGTTLINYQGANTYIGQHDVAASGFDLSAIPLNEWRTLTGYFRGYGTSGIGVAPNVDLPTPLYNGIRYFRPVIIMNYQNGNGTQELDFIKIERLAVPDDADNTLKQRAIPDAEFSLSTAQVYWALTKQAGDPLANDPTGISISASGGVSGGKLVLSGDSTNKYANSNRNPPFRVVTGQQFTVYLRWQRTTAISAANGTNTVLLAQCVTDFGPPYPVSTAVGSGNIQLTRDQVNSVAANQWQETSFVATISNAPKSNAQYPYAHFLVGMPAACTGGVIEVDALVAVSR